MNTVTGRSCMREVVTVRRDSTVADAAALMRSHHVGAVVMVEERESVLYPAGLLTDRDIAIEVVAVGLEPATLRVEEVLRRPIATAKQDASCEEIAREMAIHGVRRLPLVNESGELTGVVALDDILLRLIAPLVAVAELPERERRFETNTRR